MLTKNVVAGIVGGVICTSAMISLFLHSYGCDPYDEYLAPPRPDFSSGDPMDNPYGLYTCFSSPLLPAGGPHPGLCWVIALIGLFLTARLSVESHQPMAVAVGIVSPLLAALIGFLISGLDPTMVLTDQDFYLCLPLTVTFGVIFAKLERRRLSI